MFRTINLHAEIPSDRTLHVTLPDDVPAGPADVAMIITTSEWAMAETLGDLAGSEFFGMWKDRPAITTDFATRLRDEGWKRSA